MLVCSLVNNMDKGKKRIFILLGMATMLAYVVIFAVLWLIFSSSSAWLRQVLLIAVIAAFVLLLLAMLAGMGSLVFSLLFWNDSRKLHKLNRYIVELFYPAVMRVGKFFGISQEAIEDSYIKINNQMTLATGNRFRPEDILILAPHCLQKTDCPHKITVDVHNCHRCGRCSVDGLLTLAEDNGVRLVVASGGTFARKFAKEYKPKAIIAIACERDLTSGIRDMKSIPVVGVLNERPNGPCYNTSVQLCKVQQAIDYFMQNET